MASTSGSEAGGGGGDVPQPEKGKLAFDFSSLFRTEMFSRFSIQNKKLDRLNRLVNWCG